MTRTSRSALIVSDSAPLRRYARGALTAVGAATTEAANGFQAMDRLSEQVFDLYFLDLDMPVSDELATFSTALLGKFHHHSMIIIGCSAVADGRDRNTAWADQSKLAHILPKPFHPEDLITAAKAALNAGQLRRPR